MTSPAPDLRPGSAVESHAIIMSVLALKESDRLVHLLTPQWGLLTTVARQAARSQKRFGAALEPLNHVKVHLRVPRDTSATESPLWRLDKADLQDSFLHLRQSYARLESAFFVLRLVKDLLPEAAAEASVFKSLGRFLRDSEVYGTAKPAIWLRFAFWTWFTFHLGFGDLSEGFLPPSPSFVTLWHDTLAAREADFARLFRVQSQIDLPGLDERIEFKIYQRWLELSGIHWNYFEQWIATKSSSLSL